MRDKTASEFGEGFTYNIGLFLAHAERKEDSSFNLWFNGAADHLFELKIPNNFILKKECEDWQKKCLEWRFDKYTEENKNWAIGQAKMFLREWDKQNNISVNKGERE